MELLLELFAWIGANLISLGGLGIVLGVALKYLAPMCITWLQARFSGESKILTALLEIKTVLQDNGKTLSSFSSELSIVRSEVKLLASNPFGQADKNIALHVFKSTLDKSALKMLAEYRYRTMKNHILTQGDAVSSRYQRYANNQAEVVIASLDKFAFEGKPLGDFFETHGALSFFSHTMDSLYSCQWLNANNTLEGKEIEYTEEDINSAMDALLIKMFTAFETWLTNGDTFVDQKTVSIHKFKLDLDVKVVK
jgi:hypothetical protein